MKICNKCKLDKETINFVKNPISKDKLHYTCKDCTRQSHLIRTLKNKIIVMKHYSNNDIKCICCGVKELEFLAIDHTNGGGNTHRNNIGVRSGWTFYGWLIKNNFPQGFRVLCHNCNQASGNFGNCPHKGTTIYTGKY